jgi:hypothetical protein
MEVIHPTIGGYMKDNSRIRFNPATKEIEIEGTEAFVKKYFNKLQTMVSGALEETVKEPKAVKVRPTKKANEATRKAPKVKRVTNIDTVVGLIRESVEGISTAELKKKTGLVESQIWSIVNRAAKEGKIRKVKRGVYGLA